MMSAYARDPYYAQSNDPRDLYRAHWNLSQERQQDRLSGGSWSQPVWTGWKPIIGAGHQDMFQRYAQDGDSGFFYGMRGSGNPLGVNPFPPDNFETEENYDQEYQAPDVSTILPVMVQPSAEPQPLEMEQELHFNAEPEQRAKIGRAHV